MESKNLPIQRESTQFNQLYSSASQEKTFSKPTDQKICLVASILFGVFSSSLVNAFRSNLQRITSQRSSTEEMERLKSPDQEQGEVLIEAGVISDTEKSLTLDSNAEPLDDEGRTPLAAACLDEDLVAVKRLLESGANIEAVDQEGRTPLALACFCNNIEIAEMLLRAGADVNTVDSSGMTPLAAACEDGNVDMIEILLKAGADIELADDDGKTPFAIACCRGKTEAVDRLLIAGANIDTTDLRGRTPLTTACEDGNVSMLKKLLKASAKKDVVDNFDWTPLTIALRNRNIQIIRTLLKAGVHLERTNREGRTPLALACTYGEVEIVEMLLKAGADKEAVDKRGRTPLMLSAFADKADVIDTLLKFGANLEAVDNEGETVLAGLCWRGKTQLVIKLLQAGAMIEAIDKDGRTPLSFASVSGEIALVDALLKAGANINAINYFGRTPLMNACLHGKLDIAEMLLAAGAEVKAIDDYGDTALSLAMTSPAFKGSSVIEELKAKDHGVTHELMLCKELAHRFGIEGTVSLLGEEFSLIGWRLAPAQALLSSKVHSYYMGLSLAIEAGFPEPAAILQDEKPNVWANIYKGLSAATRELIDNRLSAESLKKILDDTEQAVDGSLPTTIVEAQHRADEGKPVGLLMDMQIGPEQRSEHAVAMAFLKVGDKWRVARCNKGYGSGTMPGIIIHTTADPFDPGKYYPVVPEDFHLEGFERDCSLTDEVYIQQKNQKVGNCTVANSNGMELALLYLQFEQILGPAAALELAQAIKKGRCEDSREGTLKEYNDYHAIHTEIPSNVDLLEKIQQKFNHIPEIKS
jgi:ankyrin repeat protein